MVSRTLGVMTLLNLLTAVFGVVNSIVTAHYFGTTRAMEVYFAAVTLFAMVASLTQTGQVMEIFLPVYHRLKYNFGLIPAQQAFAIILNWMLLVLVAVTAALWFVAPAIIRAVVPGFAPQDHILGTEMLRWLLPLVASQVWMSLFQMLLNAEGQFTGSETLACAATGTTLIAVIGFARPFGIWANVVSIWVGQAIQLIGLALLVRRTGYQHRWILHSQHFHAWQVFKHLVYTLGHVGLTQLFVTALNAGLSLLPQGTFGVYKYVEQLFTKARGILLRPITVVFSSRISEALAKGSGEVPFLMREALARSLFLVSIAVVAIAVAGHPLLAALWGGARFSAAEVGLGASLLLVFFLLMYTSILGALGRRIAVSLDQTVEHYFLSGVVQASSAVLCWTLIPRLGLWGVIATTTLNAIALALVPAVLIARSGRGLVLWYAWPDVWRWITAVAAGTVIGRAFGAAGSSEWMWGLSRVGQVGWAGVLVGCSLAVTLTIGWVLAINEVQQFVALSRSTIIGFGRRIGQGLGLSA